MVRTDVPDQDPVRLSAVLEGFTEAALKSPDPLVREACIESVVDVLKPRGDELDSGRVSNRVDLSDRRSLF